VNSTTHELLIGSREHEARSLVHAHDAEIFIENQAA
jgi:hypothetical protein